MAAVMTCSKCNGPLALADERCPACGEPVPASARRGVLVARAEAQAEEGLYAEAARGLEPVLKLDIDAAEAKLLWRKRGGWLLRSGRPELLDAAEASMAEALRLDDSDDMSHQLWIDLLARRGHLEKAKQWYAQRLELNPDDVMARRQQQIIRLSADFKSAPPPKLNIPDAKPGLFARALKPTPTKLASAALAVVGSLAQLGWIVTGGGGSAITGDALSGANEMGSIAAMINDPWLPGIQALIFGAYLVWGWKNRRD